MARETAQDAEQLARQMGRDEIKAASVAWAMREGVAAAHEREQAEAARQQARERARTGDGDRLRAKVRTALEARQRQHAQDMARGQEERSGSEAAIPATAGVPGMAELRAAMQSMDHAALREAARADRVEPVWQQRSMTIEDAARLVSRTYAGAANRAASFVRKRPGSRRPSSTTKACCAPTGSRGDKRWRDMGFLRRAMHKAGLRRDHWLGNRADARTAAARVELGDGAVKGATVAMLPGGFVASSGVRFFPGSYWEGGL